MRPDLDAFCWKVWRVDLIQLNITETNEKYYTQTSWPHLVQGRITPDMFEI